MKNKVLNFALNAAFFGGMLYVMLALFATAVGEGNKPLINFIAALCE